MKFRFWMVLVLVILSVFAVAKEKIVVNSYISDPAPRIVLRS